ncbi:unnamed protein product [Blepharisma stoltei]|uniref:Nuclear transport factor 2 n=1 Tax=Blepharisma stoltei TaxID=1481888 RepID=A0AAU9K0S3_9CILI|nr:unnamed protein product [Blepharisma stoltei]
MADFNTLGLQFAQFYYNGFQSNRESLRVLFNADSMLTFESDHFKGADAIMVKFHSLTAQSIVHHILTLDVQPSTTQGSMIILVTGQLQMDQDAPLKFSQVFHLIPAAGSYVCTNNLFRLNLG